MFLKGNTAGYLEGVQTTPDWHVKKHSQEVVEEPERRGSIMSLTLPSSAHEVTCKEIFSLQSIPENI